MSGIRHPREALGPTVWSMMHRIRGAERMREQCAVECERLERGSYRALRAPIYEHLRALPATAETGKGA